MIGRFLYRGREFFGRIEGEKVTGERDGRTYSMRELKTLPPMMPSKVICIGLNYIDHAKELNMKVPDEPVIFLKPPTSIIGHGDHIIYPRSCTQLDYEAELAVIIGKRCKNVKKARAQEAILGYTCFNDVTARDLQRKDGQWTRSKSFDTFAPLGPYIAESIEDGIDPGNLRIMSRLNGKLRQDSSTANFIFDIPTLVEFISHIMTLESGDVIATGTPFGVGSMNAGDMIEIEIERIGVLRNKVVSAGAGPNW